MDSPPSLPVGDRERLSDDSAGEIRPGGFELGLGRVVLMDCVNDCGVLACACVREPWELLLDLCSGVKEIPTEAACDDARVRPSVGVFLPELSDDIDGKEVRE